MGTACPRSGLEPFKVKSFSLERGRWTPTGEWGLGQPARVRWDTQLVRVLEADALLAVQVRVAAGHSRRSLLYAG
ncbi:MAG TPA: hypothetical protein VNB23_01025 [Ramlibacter sp.]|nr:hypothetical protein [Ramlibacter sp.]